MRRDGLSLWVDSTETVAERQPDMARLRLPCELRQAVPGFYLATGESMFPARQAEPLLRLYWHLTPPAAPALLGQLSSSLNRLGIPFELQTVNDPTRYSRCDAGELNLPCQHYQAVIKSLRKIHTQLLAELHDTTPAFTKRLGPGLGLAEDPGDGQSFGMHRIALLSEAAVRAYERGEQSTHTRVSLVEEIFDEHGLDLDRPFLNSGSIDEYELISPG
jgi:hypothetical protein